PPRFVSTTCIPRRRSPSADQRLCCEAARRPQLTPGSCPTQLNVSDACSPSIARRLASCSAQVVAYACRLSQDPDRVSPSGEMPGMAWGKAGMGDMLPRASAPGASLGTMRRSLVPWLLWGVVSWAVPLMTWTWVHHRLHDVV